MGGDQSNEIMRALRDFRGDEEAKSMTSSITFAGIPFMYTSVSPVPFLI